LNITDIQDKITNRKINSLKNEHFTTLEAGLDNNTLSIEKLNEQGNEFKNKLITLEKQITKLNEDIETNNLELKSNLTKDIESNLKNKVTALKNDCTRKFREIKLSQTPKTNDILRKNIEDLTNKVNKQIETLLINQTKYEETLQSLDIQLENLRAQRTPPIDYNNLKVKADKLEEYNRIIERIYKIKEEISIPQYSKLINELQDLRVMVYKEPRIDNLQLEYKLLFKNKPKTKILFEPIVTNEGEIALQLKNEKANTFINSLINESYLSKEKDFDKSFSNIQTSVTLIILSTVTILSRISQSHSGERQRITKIILLYYLGIPYPIKILTFIK